MKNIIHLLLLTVVFYSSSCNNNKNSETSAVDESSANPAPPVLSYSIVKVYPHDTLSYTEGLFLHDNALYESTGQKKESKLRKINIETGKPEKEISLDTAYFGEGISMINDKIYQLTWQEHKVFVYDAQTFKKIKEMQWPFEGWGMTTDGKQLIISTGSSNLYFVNPENFKIIKQVGVTNNYGPVGNINELEYVNGVIYANIYQTNNIIKIDPETGKVLAQIDLTGILDSSGMMYNHDRTEVLNGIAYDSAKNIFYVTGKYWPALFEIKLN